MRIEKRILVVDDDDAIRMLVTTVLRRRGLGVDSARNGAEAMEHLRQCGYALVVLDLMMPRMSGYDVLERLAAMPLAMRPAVLVLTAGIAARSFDSSLVLGTIHKPFDIELLVDTVSATIAALPGQQQPEDCPPTGDSLPLSKHDEN
jgi:DNA-binding response OmpR family regulator